MDKDTLKKCNEAINVSINYCINLLFGDKLSLIPEKDLNKLKHKLSDYLNTKLLAVDEKGNSKATLSFKYLLDSELEKLFLSSNINSDLILKPTIQITINGYSVNVVYFCGEEDKSQIIYSASLTDKKVITHHKKDKKTVKRYSLVEYVGEHKKVFNNMSEYQSFIKIMSNYNAKSKIACPSFGGNVSYIELPDGKIEARYYKYNRLTDRMTLEELDAFTSQFDLEGLVMHYKDSLRKIGDTPDINIAYAVGNGRNKIKYDNKITYTPVMYTEDKQKLTDEYVENNLYYRSVHKDIKFLKDLYKLFEKHKGSDDELDALLTIINHIDVGEQSDTLAIYSVVRALYYSLMAPKDRYGNPATDKSVRIKKVERDFKMFIRDYDLKDSERRIPTRYNLSAKKIIVNSIEKDSNAQEESQKRLLKPKQISFFEK